MYIAQLRTGQNTLVLLFKDVCADKVLPVFAQQIGRAVAGKGDAAAPLSRLQAQMHLGIMAQRLIMTITHHRLGDGFPIQDAAVPEIQLDTKTTAAQLPQHLQLDLTHDADVDLLQFLLKADAQRRILVLQDAQLF